MFDHVLVGVDGDEGGRDAIALAKVLHAENGTVTLGYIYPRESRAWRGTTEGWDEAEIKRSTELLHKAASEAGIEALPKVHGTVSVGRGLHELGEAIGADLLVIGSSKRGAVGRVFLGDDTHDALNGAPSAVAVAPAGYAQASPEIKVVGVGFNGSAESEQAIDTARKVADAHNAKLSAMEAIFYPGRRNAAPAWPAPADIEQELAAARKHIAGLGGVEAQAAYGEPAEELALFSGSVDLLIIGSRGYGPIGRLVHGRTAQKLARTARCPLLVLTRASRHQDAAAGGARETARATV
jgi:nucleotide-binding universal stress UspA family protein